SRRATRARRDEMRASKAAVLPPSIRCRCGFSDPGTRAAMSQLDALSSMARWMVGLTLSIDCIAQLHRLIRAVEVSAQPVPIASGTRLLPVSRVRAAHGFPPHARRSFFERVHGVGILPVSLGPGAHMREAQGLEGAKDSWPWSDIPASRTR